MLSRKQKFIRWAAAGISALTFTFSPVGMTIMIGELVQSKIKSLYEKLTTSVAVMNGTTESTYLAEIIIPLVAFGIPLSPISMGVGFALFNAPPVFTIKPIMHNVHTLMTPLQVFGYGMMAVLIASLISYPLSMNYARKASAWVMRKISQEAILTMFAGLIIVLSYYEAAWVGVIIAITVGILGGIFSKYFGINIGVQFMTYYAAPWIVFKLFGLK
jgi:putative tricarboxylic transport membrane protein